MFRFAPSPTGALHLGHAYCALLNDAMAREAGGRLLLRIEDIDAARCTPAFARAIEADLACLGLRFAEPPRRQSEHLAGYRAALARLEAMELLYPAFLSRGAVRAHAEASRAETGRPWPTDPDGALLYPPLDRALPAAERRRRMAAGEPFAWRLDMGKALAALAPLVWQESGPAAPKGGGTVAADPAAWGDVVLARRDAPASYHLAVTVDDAAQGVTHVVRGLDLFFSTAVHRVLQALLGLPAPAYHHHRLILAPDGRKLSKSARDLSLAALCRGGMTAGDIARLAGFPGPAGDAP